ncbi:MAG: hypothetical protein V4598_07525 [Bdellovibrionota bacterium]
MATVIQHAHHQTNDNIGLYDSSEMLTVVIGFVMLILSAAGLLDKGFLGLDLSPMHCFVLAGSGALAVWAGFTSEEDRERAYKVDLTLGLFYLANVVAGLMLPTAMKNRSVFNEGLVREIAPGFLDLRNYDHFLHGALAFIFFMSAWSCWKKMRSTGQQSYN